jgi:hypothetical protein
MLADDQVPGADPSSTEIVESETAIDGLAEGPKSMAELRGLCQEKSVNSLPTSVVGFKIAVT